MRRYYKGVDMRRVRVAGLALALVLAGCDREDLTYRLREPVGHDWRNERVTFPLSGAALRLAWAGHALIGPDGEPVAYQVLPADGGAPPSLAFLVGLPPDAAHVYAFGEARVVPATDLAVAGDADQIRLTNGQTGIALRKGRSPSRGPSAWRGCTPTAVRRWRWAQPAGSPRAAARW